MLDLPAIKEQAEAASLKTETFVRWLDEGQATLVLTKYQRARLLGFLLIDVPMLVTALEEAQAEIASLKKDLALLIPKED